MVQDGAVRVVGKEASERLRARGGRFRLVADRHGMLLLRREIDPSAPKSGARVLMAGELVSRTTVLEIINFVATAGWRGELHVIGETTRRVLTFDQGAVKSASSDDPEDRLGEVLTRLGMLSEDDHRRLGADVGADKRFGELLVESGLATPEQLFKYLQKQVEHVFNAALLVSEGSYAFVSIEEGTAPSSTTVHLSAQGLLMEGVQRIDEMALFRERIPHGEMCPVLVPNAPMPPKLDENLKLVLFLVNGRRTVNEIARDSGADEFQTTKALYHLLQTGVVKMRASAKVDPEQVRKLVVRFNEVIRDVFAAVATYGGMRKMRDTLGTWAKGGAHATILGEIDEDGSLDADHVTRALASGDHERPLEALHRALHELSAYALFTATGQLPRYQELSLARDVTQRMKAIRI